MCVCVCVCVCVYTHTHRDIYTLIYIYIHTYTYTHTMKYYSVIKKNEIFPFATTLMDLEVLCLMKYVRQILYDITYIWNLKNTTN